MLTTEDIIKIMDQPLKSANIGYYREIHQMSTGVDFTSCLCGNGANRLYNICKAYSEALKKQLKL